MKQLIITLEDDDRIKFETGDGGDPVSYSDSIGMLLDSLEGLMGNTAKLADSEHLNELHDYFSYALSSIMGRVFPDSNDFSLTDAAVYKAQNELLQKSMDEGRPLEEIVQEYNEAAEKEIEDYRHGSESDS